MKKTSHADFEKFKEYTRQYIDKFGLIEYELYFVHGCPDDNSDFSDALSEISTLVEGKAATFYLNTDWTDALDKICDETLKRIALHEVLHLLLAEYWYYASSRFGVSKTVLGTVEHTIVRRLENFILGV